jgi:hypothetical protein
MHAKPDVVCPSSAERASVEEKNGCMTSIGRVRWQHRLRSLALPLLGAHQSPPARRSVYNALFWTASIYMFEDEVHTLTLSVSPTAILYKRRCMTHLTPSHRASMSASTQNHMQAYFRLPRRTRTQLSSSRGNKATAGQPSVQPLLLLACLDTVPGA